MSLGMSQDSTLIKPTERGGGTFCCKGMYQLPNMETLPQEMLSAIALELPIADVRHFRLASRRFAAAGFPALVRNLAVLDTIHTAHAFETLHESPYASLGAARHLTIYTGCWPSVTSREEWTSHFLFLQREYRDCTEESIRHAYQRYRNFIHHEASRTYEKDIHQFKALLTALGSFLSSRAPSQKLCHAFYQLSRLSGVFNGSTSTAS
jgi:hypothetical protein